MADPVALQILKAVKLRLDDISVSNGYNNDAEIQRGQSGVNPNQIDAGAVISVFDEGDNPTEEQNACLGTIVEQTLTIEGVQQFGTSVPGDVMAYLWQDIIRAVFLPDTTIGGLALSVQRGPREFIYPQPGGQTVAVRQAVNIIYEETYGNP